MRVEHVFGQMEAVREVRKIEKNRLLLISGDFVFDSGRMAGNLFDFGFEVKS